MRQFLVPAGSEGLAEIRLSGKDARYIRDVLRLGPGEAFDGVDASGKRVRLRILSSSQAGLVLAMEKPEGTSVALPPSPSITLIQALPKGAKMDLVVRQAVEGGVSRILPLETKRSVPRLAEGHEAKFQRWERILREAVQQSGSLRGPRLERPLPFDELPSFLSAQAPNGPGNPLRLFFHEAPLEQESLHGYLSAFPEEVAVLIGPEGGLSTEETIRLRGWGFKPAYLGDRVLRTETAALFAVAAIQVILMERASWASRP